MKSSHLEQALAHLKSARSQMRNVADIRITEELDNAISVLEEETKRRGSGNADASARALAYLDRALRLFPVIEKVLRELNK